MLVLSRKVGERIQLGEDVVLTVLKVGHNRIQIGISAPRDLDVRRSEIVPAKPLLSRAVGVPTVVAGTPN